MITTTMSRLAFYPVNDRKYPAGTMVQWTGEFRKPRQGEWFLFGSPVLALEARADLTEQYYIARLCQTTSTTTIVDAKTPDRLQQLIWLSPSQR